MSTTKSFTDTSGSTACFCKDHTYLSTAANEVATQLASFKNIGEVYSSKAKASQLSQAFMQWYDGQTATKPDYIAFAMSGQEILLDNLTANGIGRVWSAFPLCTEPTNTSAECSQHTAEQRDLADWLATKLN